MDIEHVLHLSYRKSIVVAVVLSLVIVAAFALLGRGTLNLRSALVLDEPTDVTVIAVVEPKLVEDEAITRIEFLRKEPTPEGAAGRPFYAYLVETSDGVQHLVRLGWNADEAKWDLIVFERLHGTSD